MHHWGRGRFTNLSIKLRSPQARKFSSKLDRACGCQLAWHRLRNTYVVYRDRGARPPKTYLDVGHQCPLQFSWMPFVVRAVRFADARENQDYGRMFEEMERQDNEDRDARTYSFVDDRLPEFYRDLKRLREMLSAGRKETKYFDLGSRT